MPDSFPKFLVLYVLIFVLCGSGCVKSEHVSEGLVTLTSWDQTVLDAKKLNRPIVLLVEQRNCGFCQALKKNLIKPLANDSHFGSKAIYVSMMTDYDEPTLEKDGRQISGFDYSMQLDASTTPTVLFFNSEGEELQKRVVGYLETDEYIATMKSRIERSAAAVTGP
ncbi:MAG: thioredoxin family protein [Gammaproteobacteria bacterium]